MGVIKVAIADDHKIFRKGVILSLRPYSAIKFVQEAENGQELLDGLAASEPDVVLMDLRMPQKDGIETTKIIAKQYPSIHIIALTMYEDERFVSHMMEIGANGYLLKSADPSEIKRAIIEVATKGYYLNNFVNRILLKKSHVRTKTIPSLNTEITLNDREREVVRYICMEFTAQEIAQKIDVSPRTVEAIKDRLMERFGAKNTAGLVFFAVKNNLIDYAIPSLQHHFRHLGVYYQPAGRLAPDLVHSHSRRPLEKNKTLGADVEYGQVRDDPPNAVHSGKRKGTGREKLGLPLGIGVLHGDDDIAGAGYKVHCAAHSFHHLAGDLPVGNIPGIRDLHRP